MERYYNNLINAYLVHVGVRPASLLQQVDFKNETEVFVTLDKIKELFPELHHISNYQGILLSKTLLDDNVNTCQKLGKILGYPYSDEFKQILDENISGYVIELNCYYLKDNILYKTQIIVNRCIELNKLNEFKEIEKKENQYCGYKIDDIEIVKFNIHYEKNYNTKEILNYVYEYKPYDEHIIYHIGNIIYNMGIENTEFMLSFQYNNRFHRYIILMMLYIDDCNIRLPEYSIKTIEWALNTFITNR